MGSAAFTGSESADKGNGANDDSGRTQLDSASDAKTMGNGPSTRMEKR